ncbi:hypothetical protein Syun_017560 [Stephania yunnanensis]|uniref:Uncharacterized protein n=1 Tax=Stephania yunnanensis TaxID=152371 RepID=A0AAP0J9F2_9MAGN
MRDNNGAPDKTHLISTKQSSDLRSWPRLQASNYSIKDTLMTHSALKHSYKGRNSKKWTHHNVNKI